MAENMYKKKDCNMQGLIRTSLGAGSFFSASFYWLRQVSSKAKATVKEQRHLGPSSREVMDAMAYHCYTVSFLPFVH